MSDYLAVIKSGAKRKEVIVGVVVAIVAALAIVIPLGAHQYTATGSAVTSALPPNTRAELLPLLTNRQAVPVNNAMFGASGNVLEITDASPIRPTGLYEQFSGPNAVEDEASQSVDYGPLPVGSEIVPIFVRGTRVFSFIVTTGNYAWLQLVA